MKQLLKKMGAILLIAFSVSSCTRAFITFYNKKDPMKKKSVWVKEDREICHVLKMVYSYFVSLIYIFHFLS